jgi:hypothetical protein
MPPRRNARNLCRRSSEIEFEPYARVNLPHDVLVPQTLRNHNHVVRNEIDGANVFEERLRCPSSSIIPATRVGVGDWRAGSGNSRPHHFLSSRDLPLAALLSQPFSFVSSLLGFTPTFQTKNPKPCRNLVTKFLIT